VGEKMGEKVVVGDYNSFLGILIFRRGEKLGAGHESWSR